MRCVEFTLDPPGDVRFADGRTIWKYLADLGKSRGCGRPSKLAERRGKNPLVKCHKTMENCHLFTGKTQYVDFNSYVELPEGSRGEPGGSLCFFCGAIEEIVGLMVFDKCVFHG